MHRALAVWIAAVLVAAGAAASHVHERTTSVRTSAGSSSPLRPGPSVSLPVVTVPVPPVTVEVPLPTVTIPPPTIPTVTVPPPVDGLVQDVTGRPGAPVTIDHHGLWLVDADTGTARLLFGDLYPSAVSFSADGNRAAVTTHDDATYNGADPVTLWITDLTTGVREAIVGPTQGLGDLSWSPDGQWVAYSLVPTGGVSADDPSAPPGPHGVSELWVVHPDGSSRHRVAVIDGSGGTPRWSADSTRLAASLTNDGRILVADVSRGTEARFPADHPYLVSWSPDGTRLAWSSSPFPNASGGTSIMDAASGSSSALCADCYFPRWSPSSEALAVRRGDSTQLVTSDGTLGQVVGQGSPLDWSTDGAMLDFAAGTHDVSVADATGTTSRIVATSPAGDALSPTRWVPGGHQVAIIDSGRTAWYAP